MVVVIIAVWILGCGVAVAGDSFVITATFDSQTQAQAWAAVNGGWVLDTDLYPALKPNHFAVVRGPFALSKAAATELAALGHGSSYEHAYVKDGGNSRLPTSLTNGVPPALVAALLGEISIEIEEHAGGANPCEPQEPYQSVALSYAGVVRRYDATTDQYPIVASRVPIDIGSFWVIKRTGEIDRMRACFE